MGCYIPQRHIPWDINGLNPHNNAARTYQELLPPLCFLEAHLPYRPEGHKWATSCDLPLSGTLMRHMLVAALPQNRLYLQGILTWICFLKPQRIGSEQNIWGVYILLNCSAKQTPLLRFMNFLLNCSAKGTSLLRVIMEHSCWSTIMILTCCWIYKLALLCMLLNSLFTVHCARGQDHGRVVFIHELLCDGTDEPAVHMLGIRQAGS